MADNEEWRELGDEEAEENPTPVSQSYNNNNSQQYDANNEGEVEAPEYPEDNAATEQQEALPEEPLHAEEEEDNRPDEHTNEEHQHHIQENENNEYVTTEEEEGQRLEQEQEYPVNAPEESPEGELAPTDEREYTNEDPQKHEEADQRDSMHAEEEVNPDEQEAHHSNSERRLSEEVQRKEEVPTNYGGEAEEREFPPHTQEVNDVFKPRKLPYRQPSRWDPIEYDLREDSDDEFEMTTAMRPVYDEEEEGSTTPVFKNGEPDAKGEYLSCFDEPNLLYRIYNREEKTWAFYNDTCKYEMHVQFTFGKHSKLEPLENTTMHTKSTGERVAEVVVYPGETEMFVKGTVNGFTSKLRALPLSDEYYQRRQKLSENMIYEEISQIKNVVGDEENAEKVLRACVENGIPFVDLEFPPCQASLETGAKKPFKTLPWARPSSYLPDDMVDQVRLFRGPIRPAGVDQGELGDSWLMCSIAVVSESPQNIVNMFRHPTDPEMGKKERSVGGYRVTFNKNGIWRSVIVDNYLPTGGGKPKYAKSSNDLAEIWPSILQKAFAKLHGSYANICSGDPLHALQDMTGYPSRRFDEAFAEATRSGKDDLFQEWVKYAQNRYQIVLSTPGKDPKDGNSNDPKLAKRYKSVGLVTGHAYAILDAKYFSEYELRLVKIRNAWGRGAEWNGDWCDDDEKWEQYPDVAEVCQFQKADDGTFWMTWEACLHYFNGGGVCFSHPSLNDYRVASKFVECAPSCVLEVSVEQPTWMCLTLSQQDKRGRPNASEYQPVMISIAQPTENELYRVVQNSSADAYHPLSDKWTFFQARDISLIHKFLPEHSPYLVVPRLMQMDGQAEEVPYTLGVSCNRAIGHDGVTVHFKTIDKDNKVMHNFPKFEPETTPVEVEYQAKMTGKGFPEIKTGSTVY